MASKMQDLLLEKESLEVRIRALESAIRSLEVKIKGKEDLKFIPNEIQEIPKVSPDVNKLKKLISLSSLVARIDFDCLVEVNLDNTITVTSGNGFCEEVKFYFQLEVEKPSRIKNILLTFEDSDLQNELKTWQKRLCREKDFQSMMNGIAQHASLISRMNSILDWLTDTFRSNLQVQSKNSVGCLVTSTKKDEHDECILSVHWKIKWVKYEKLMTDKFILEINDKDLFDKKRMEDWSKFFARNHFLEDQLKQFWMEINDELASSE